jgi:hypothetical protein
MNKAYQDLQNSLDSEEYSSALLLCEQILLTLPSDDSIKICKGVCLVQLGNYKQAEQLFSQNNQLLKQDSLFAYARVFASFMQARFKEAVELCQQYM